MRKVVRFGAALAVSALAATAQAQEAPKIGFVNTERILRESSAAKAAQQKLEQEFSRRDKELQENAARLRQMSERLERDVSVLSDGDRGRRQRELAELDREFQRKQREFREDLNQRRNEELATVIERANRVIKQLAEQERYDLILQEAVFASPRIDVTEKVLRALNAQK
jgi:outer membrane protein